MLLFDLELVDHVVLACHGEEKEVGEDLNRVPRFLIQILQLHLVIGLIILGLTFFSEETRVVVGLFLRKDVLLERVEVFLFDTF